MANEIDIVAVEAYLSSLQAKIVEALQKLEDKKFALLPWKSKLGEGRGMLVEQGKTLERGGVSFSKVSADSLPVAATKKNPGLKGEPYEAMGLSLVMHPLNPFAPNAHMNVRFFSTTGNKRYWWFGGGMDLTPHYGFVDDCVHFHSTCKKALDEINKDLYPKYKANCDDYFHIKHRGQMRGIGGVFFDDLSEEPFGQSFAIMKAVGEAFIPAYLPILERRRNTQHNARHRAHQLHRRGRYVEFNLVQDRGTLFGLQSGGEADAILMSLPPLASWDRTATQRDVADEKNLANDFLVPKDWA